MNCSDARTFLSQIAGKSVTMPINQSDMDFLSTNQYVSVMPKEEYDQASAEVANLARVSEELQYARMRERSDQATLEKEWKKTHSIMFHFEPQEKKEADLQNEESESSLVAGEQADLAERDAKVNELIEKKSIIDRMVPYDGKYLSLTGLGVIILNDLNVRNYRVSDTEFSDFVEEIRTTLSELRSIAETGSYHVSNLRTEFQEAGLSQLWSVAIGLAKLQGDPSQIGQRFLLAVDILKHFDGTLENKMMAGEIMTAYRNDPSQPTNNSDLQSLSETLANLDHDLRHKIHVPKQLSTGIAATMMFGRRFDGTFPTDRFAEFCKMTNSYETAAILSIMNVPADQLVGNFQTFRSLFNSWGYELSEDTELASAYLAISDLGPYDVNSKLAIIVNGLRNYLEYPLVASAILASISTLEANETLDLMEKAYSLLGAFAAGLERSELVSLSVRMIHGIKNELVKELDPTAKIVKTPVQFTYVPTYVFFFYHAPIIIAHSSYYSTFSGIGGYHPAHVHGVGGFMG